MATANTSLSLLASWMYIKLPLHLAFAPLTLVIIVNTVMVACIIVSMSRSHSRHQLRVYKSSFFPTIYLGLFAPVVCLVTITVATGNLDGLVFSLMALLVPFIMGIAEVLLDRKYKRYEQVT